MVGPTSIQPQGLHNHKYDSFDCWVKTPVPKDILDDYSLELF